MYATQGTCVVYHPALLSRISAAEERARYSPLLPVVREEFRRRLHDAVATNGEYGRVPMHSGDVGSNGYTLGSGSLEGYPEKDDDVQDMFEDATSISEKLVEEVRSALLAELGNVRKTAKACIIELERVLAEQIPFRPITSREIERRREYVITRFLRARQEIINKFENFISTRKWMEGSGTSTQRSGSHSFRQLLRLWLFKNFSDPYPSADEKEKLCAETGMTKNQIDYWFINARARVWKPTVSLMSGDHSWRDSQPRGAGGERDPKALLGISPTENSFANGHQNNSQHPGADSHVQLPFVASTNSDPGVGIFRGDGSEPSFPLCVLGSDPSSGNTIS